MGKIINNFLIAIILFIAYPSNAYSLNLVNAEISANNQSVKPVKPLKAVKSKKKKHKQAKKKQLDATKFYDYLIIFLALAGITSFIIGLFLASFPLWLTGLIVYSAINLFLYVMYYLIVFSDIYFEKIDHLEVLGTGILILLLDLINLILAIAFVILGLSFAIPVFWIVGLSILGFLALSIILFFILTKLM
jgi:hypothetical protein